MIKKDKVGYFEYLIAGKKEILEKLENSENNNLKENNKKEIKTLEKLLEECRTISTD